MQETPYHVCRRLFDFEGRYAMDLVDLDDGQWEHSMLFRRDGREVLILIEARGSYGIPHVQIRPLDPSQRFTLYELLPALGQAHPDFGTELSSAELQATLSVYADVFHAHADELLGDYARLWAAVKDYRASRA